MRLSPLLLRDPKCGLPTGSLHSAVSQIGSISVRLIGAMISYVIFGFRNIFSKKWMSGESVFGINYDACLSMLMLSLLLHTPLAIAMRDPKCGLPSGSLQPLKLDQVPYG